MSEPKLNPVKLASGRRLFAPFAANRQTLWMAGDHLLLQVSTGYTERTRRFYFADIQSIVYARTSVGAVLNIVCAVMAAVLLVVGFLSVPDLGMAGGAFLIAITALPFLLLLIVNMILGPTCACVVSTAVHKERVLALNRITKVERALGQILPRIDAAQGRVSAETFGMDGSGADFVEAGQHALEGNAARIVPMPELGNLQGRPEAETRAANFVEAGLHALEGNTGRVALRHEPGNCHKVAFTLCFAMALTITVDLFVHYSVKDALDWLLVLALLAFTIASIVKQANSSLSYDLKALTYGILVIAPAYIFIATIFAVYLGVVTKDVTAANLVVMGSAPFQIFQVISISAFTLVGALGWLRLTAAGTVASVPERQVVPQSLAGDDSL